MHPQDPDHVKLCVAKEKDLMSISLLLSLLHSFDASLDEGYSRLAHVVMMRNKAR